MSPWFRSTLTVLKKLLLYVKYYHYIYVYINIEICFFYFSVLCISRPEKISGGYKKPFQ